MYENDLFNAYERKNTRTDRLEVNRTQIQDFSFFLCALYLKEMTMHNESFAPVSCFQFPVDVIYPGPLTMLKDTETEQLGREEK